VTFNTVLEKHRKLAFSERDWAKEVGNPCYSLDLLLSVVNVSVLTADIVNSLPKLTFENKSND